MSKIIYPWGDTIPESGAAIEVAEGILWMRLPLPMALDHVNIYALEDGDGWALIDTGMKWGKVETIWETLLAGPLQGKPVSKIISTHHHPDHIGMNGWFMERGAQLYTTRTAYLMGRMLTLDVQDTYTPEQITFYRRAGMRADMIEKRAKDRPFNFADMVHPIPLGFEALTEGQTLHIGGRDWTVRVDHGHAPAHATLWRDDVVISGDQIIPSISSNIGVYPTQPEANPLAEWMDSCGRLRAFAHEDQLALPGHKLPFKGIPLRLRQLLENHEGALNRLRKTLQTPHTAGEVFPDIFKRSIDDGQYPMALVESFAHCQYLYHAGEVHRTLRNDGAYLYQMKTN